MISRRENYSYLLDKLRNIYDNLNNGSREKKDERIIASMNFCYLYCLAYKALKTNNTDTFDKKKNYYELALSDYNTFNSFVNNCVKEYKLYSDVGTGEMVYIPYQILADSFFENDTSKAILMDYLNIELSDVINEEKNKELIKKID